MLKPSVIRRLANEADKLGLARIVITGGEPLIFPDLKEVIISCCPDKFYISMDTNGWFLNGLVAQNLKKQGVDRVQLSIDNYYPELHDKFRNKPGSHARAVDAARYALDAGLDLFIQTVCDKERVYSDEFTRFVDYWNDRGVGVFVSFLKAVGAAETMIDNLCGREDFDYFEKLCEGKKLFWHLSGKYGREGRCIAAWDMVRVTPWGDVTPCLYLNQPIGNVFEESLEELLKKAMESEPWRDKIYTCPAADKDWAWEK